MHQTPTTPIIDSIAKLLKTSPRWAGTATDLLHEIAVTTVTAPALSHHLRRHKNHLASHNITLNFTRKHGGSRMIKLTTTAPHAYPPTMKSIATRTPKPSARSWSESEMRPIAARASPQVPSPKPPAPGGATRRLQ
jgi:hypothetical protein